MVRNTSRRERAGPARVKGVRLSLPMGRPERDGGRRFAARACRKEGRGDERGEGQGQEKVTELRPFAYRAALPATPSDSSTIDSLSP